MWRKTIPGGVGLECSAVRQSFPEAASDAARAAMGTTDECYVTRVPVMTDETASLMKADVYHVKLGVAQWRRACALCHNGTMSMGEEAW